jgi:hypothetical protein
MIKGKIAQMTLYQRDYMTLTVEEKSIKEAMDATEKLYNTGKLRKAVNYLRYPKAVRRNLSFFPNYYLDTVDLKDETRLNDLIAKFLSDLNSSSSTETTLMANIKRNEAYFIIASILKSYDFGHHDAYIIPEFMLGNTYRVDYLIIGKNSGGYEFIFVELENPYKNITTQTGELGATFSKGIKQVNDWKRYLAANFKTLDETFNKYKNPTMELPDEFKTYEPYRLHFAVVAGRRDNFNDTTRWHKRRLRSTDDIEILHFDNLCDFATEKIGHTTYG